MLKKTLLISSILLLNACGTIPAFVGTSATTYETYKTVTFTKGAVDLGLAANDKKTTDDFVLSKITGYDCKVRRVLDEGIEAICKKYKILPKQKPELDKE
jgi:hypothetical protein|tara:strand:- start:168 stop:467 length:300 start_codon:yes stop_codon:yes gene_type:complete